MVPVPYTPAPPIASHSAASNAHKQAYTNKRCPQTRSRNRANRRKRIKTPNKSILTVERHYDRRYLRLALPASLLILSCSIEKKSGPPTKLTKAPKSMCTSSDSSDRASRTLLVLNVIRSLLVLFVLKKSIRNERGYQLLESGHVDSCNGTELLAVQH